MTSIAPARSLMRCSKISELSREWVNSRVNCVAFRDVKHEAGEHDRLTWTYTRVIGDTSANHGSIGVATREVNVNIGKISTCVVLDFHIDVVVAIPIPCIFVADV